MKVIHVGLESPAVRRGGLNIFLASLVAGQRAAGHDVEVVQVGEGVDRDANWLTRWRQVARAVRRSDADVVDVHFAAMAWWAVVSGAVRSRPLVVHFQGPWAAESAWTGQRGVILRIKRAMERSVLTRADRVITLSAAFARTAIVDYGVSPARVAIEAPGVPQRVRTTREDARRKLGLRDDDMLLVSVRRLVPRMGINHVLSALRELPEYLYVVGGTGPAREQLEAEAEAYGVSDRVRFLGEISDEDKEQWMAAANLTIVPSVAHEGFGLVVGESLAAGTPVVVAPVDGLRDAARLLPGVVMMASHEPRDVAAAVRDAHLLAVTEDALAPWSWTQVADRTVAMYVAAGQLPPGLCVIVDHTSQLSGGELALARLLPAIDPEQWRAHVILASDGPLRHRLEEIGVTVEILELDSELRERRRDELSIWRNLGTWLVFCARLRRRCRTLRPRVVMANSLKAIVYGAVSSIGIAPFVPYVRDSWSEPYLSRRVARLLRALVAIRAAGVLANSSATLADVGSGIAVPSPLEARMFEVPDMAHHHETVTMGLVGRWAPWKGQDFVIEACQGLDIPWTLNLVGDALFGELDYAADIRERIERDARIEQRGHVDDVVGELARVQVVVNGSLIREPFGNVIVEAMAAGRIVVAPSDAGAAERIEHAVNGFVYERGSTESLRAVLGDVWAARDYWHEIAARARRAVSDIRADHIAPVVESVWDEVSA